MNALLLLVALAGDLQMRGDAGPLRLHAETLLTTPSGYPFLATHNEEARAVQTEVVLDLGCTAAPKGKGLQYTCDVESARLRGTARAGEQQRLDRVFAEYKTTMEAATVQIVRVPDGRVTLVDLEGVSKKDARASTVHEDLRQLTRRALAPLDLQLPKDGEDPGKPWRQVGTPLAAELFGSTGVSGGLDLKNTVEKREGASVWISTYGTGNIQQFSNAYAGGTVNVVISGEGRFDVGSGQVVYRGLSITGEPIGANIRSDSAYTGYAQAAWVGRWNADGSMEGPDGPVRDESRPADPPTGP